MSELHDKVARSFHQDSEHLLDFANETRNDTDMVTTSIKSIIAQFLHNMRTELQVYAKNDCPISYVELIDIQVKGLREIIGDLLGAKELIQNFTNSNKKKETLQ